MEVLGRWVLTLSGLVVQQLQELLKTDFEAGAVQHRSSVL